MAKNKMDVDAIIRHHIYVDRLGGGLANRLLELMTDDELIEFVKSDKRFTMVIARIIKLQKEAAAKLLNYELNSLVRSELAWMKQLFADFRIKNNAVLAEDIVETALEHPLPVVNMTPQELYDMAFERKEVVAKNLNILVAGGIKNSAAAYQEFQGALSAFSTTMKTANTTFAHAVASEARERVWNENKDTVRGVMMAATLDGRTSKYCMNIDSKIFETGVGPRPPFHPRCRTVAVPITIDQTNKEALAQLGERPQLRPGEKYEEGDNKAMRAHKKQVEKGKVDVVPEGGKASQSYASFLASQVKSRQGKQFIEDMLGNRKGRMFIRLIEQGRKPESILGDILYNIDGRTLDIDGFKKRLKQ